MKQIIADYRFLVKFISGQVLNNIMDLNSTSLTIRVSRSMKRKPCRVVGHLSEVVKEIKSVLNSGRGVYLRSRSAPYAQRICRIRVASFGGFLRVKTAYGGELPDDLTRVEFQLRRDALKYLGVKTVQDLLERENAIVDFLTYDWFRLLPRVFDIGSLLNIVKDEGFYEKEIDRK